MGMTPVFLGFAVAYFLAALLRAITATLAPAFSSELGLGAADLGLLAGAYFFGFALLQLPLGSALDRFGPRRVQAGLMGLAVAGCGLFALVVGLPALLAARVLTHGVLLGTVTGRGPSAARMPTPHAARGPEPRVKRIPQRPE